MNVNTSVDLIWHFIDDEIEDLPANFTAGPRVENAFAMPIPAAGDLVSFERLSNVLFMVSHRRFAIGASATRPMAIHVHLDRLPKTSV